MAPIFSQYFWSIYFPNFFKCFQSCYNPVYLDMANRVALIPYFNEEHELFSCSIVISEQLFLEDPELK